MNLRFVLFFSLCGSILAQPLPGIAARASGGMTVDEVVGRMIERDATRRGALRHYTASRVYIAANKRFNKRAEATVTESYEFPGTKDLKIISVKGSSFIRRRAIDKLIEAEIESAQEDNRDQTRIGPEHYTFRLDGSESLNGRPAFVVEVIPRQEKKYLMRGKIWIDEEDFAIARVEASPAKNPSFWTRNVRVVRVYHKHGPFWLPVRTESESDIRIAGKSTLRIEYTGYRIGGADSNSRAAAAPVGEN